MTFEQCKDQIAKKKEYLDWNILSRQLVSMGHTKILDSYYTEAAELYAESLRKEIDNLKAQAKFDNVLIEQLKETDERLNSENITYRNQITDLKAEIERLKGELNPVSSLIDKMKSSKNI